MKKSILFIIAAALTLAACSDQSKALRAVKDYLHQHTVKFSIINHGDIEDFPFVFDTSDLINIHIMDIDNSILALQFAIYSDSLLYGTTNQTSYDSIRTLERRQDTLRSLLSSYHPDTTYIKRIRVTFSTPTVIGTKAINTGYFYLSDNLSTVTNYHDQ